jgi:predicted nuclease of predicted toxin-antitoxin system
VARLYANENFPLQAVQALRVLGHDVLTVAEAGNANQSIPDEDVLAFATRDQRIVLTLNRREFIRLHKSHPDHAGIIVCTQDADTSGQADRIHAAITQAEALAGNLIRVNRLWRDEGL